VRWNLWTLTRSDCIQRKKKKYILSMGDAMMRNEMALLGDYWVGTVPPLSLRIHADKNSPRILNENGHSEIKIAKVSLCANGVEITDEVEKRLAWFFMLYGKWTKIEQPVHVVDNQVEWLETQLSPEESSEQGWDSIAHMSSMLSSRYNHLTAGDAGISRLSPRIQPDRLGVLVPKGYKGAALPLWFFYQAPNYKGLHGISA
jgi:hypothetical protein